MSNDQFCDNCRPEPGKLVKVIRDRDGETRCTDCDRLILTNITPVKEITDMSKPQYYLSIAEAVAKRSKCLSRQIGAVIVKNDAIISTGFNGPPRGIPHCGKERLKVDSTLTVIKSDRCPRKVLGFNSSEGLEYCPATHAEANAIVQAAKSGVSTDRATMYLTCGVPCKSCLGLIINSGIDTVYCTSKDLYDDISKYIAEYSGIMFRSYD